MKLLILSDLNSIHTKKWIAAIANRGVEIAAFGFGKPQDDFYEQFDNVKTHHGEFQNQYGKSGLKKMRYLKKIGHLREIAADFKPDIVHAHYATSYGLLGTYLKHNHFLISVWGEDVFSFPKESFAKRILFKRNLRKAKALFSTSKVMAIETKKYTNKEVNVVPFGVDVDRFKNLNLEKTTDRIVIGIVKTLEDKYGISFLISAFNQVVNKNKNQSFELLIVGKGRKEEELKEQVRQLNLTDKVNFTGAVSHGSVPTYFNKMDIVVIPSTVDGESFGVAAVEASACEKPVIVSNVGGLPEVIIEGETGLICPPKNADCLAEKIDLLVHDQVLRDRLGKKGRQNVLENYAWEKNVDLMMEHYQKVLS